MGERRILAFMLGKPLKLSLARLEAALNKINQLEPFVALVLAFHGVALLLIGEASFGLWLIVGLMFLLGLSSFLPKEHPLNSIYFRAVGVWLLAWFMMFFHAGAASYFFFWMVVFVVTYTYYLPKAYAVALPFLAALSVNVLSLMTINIPTAAALNKFFHLNIIGYLAFFLSLQVKKQLFELKSVTTQLEEKEAFYRHHANHDPLTGLPNRRYLMQELQGAFARAERDLDYNCAVLFLDIDHLKQVNDRFGHLAGDELILEVVRRVKTCIRSTTSFARIGGDEFALIMVDLHHQNDIKRVLERINQSLKANWLWQGQEISMSVSIGISYLSLAKDPFELLSQADRAMYTAKNTGKAKYVFFAAGES